MSKPDQVAPPASPSPMRGLGCLTRMAWMLFGVVILFLSAISIAGHRGSLSTADVVFWVTVVGCIVMRYVDVSRLSGRTVTGQPATMRHWRRYAGLLLFGAGIAWGLAHAIAFFNGR